MTAPVFGFLSDLRSELVELTNNLLLVAGGFLVGYLLGGIIGWALGKWVFRQKTPETLQRLGRPLGGTILAIIVALIVFTGKGRSPGDGGDGKGTPTTETTHSKNSTPNVESNPKVHPRLDLPKTPEVKPGSVILRVTVYSGTSVIGDRFYRLDDGEELLTFDELKNAILARKATEKGNVTVAIAYPLDRNQAPGNPGPGQLSPTVSRLVDWTTTEAQLSIILPAKQ